MEDFSSRVEQHLDDDIHGELRYRVIDEIPFANEENCEKDLDEVSLEEGLNETLSSIVPFNECEVI